MSSDFWAGYLSGAAGILIGNPLDVVKVRLQASESSTPLAKVPSPVSQQTSFSSLLRGSTAPILGYGALNALLFVSYHRTLLLLDLTLPDSPNLYGVSLLKVWSAGALGGLATWIISAPTELIKCRTQLHPEGSSSWTVTKNVWRSNGLKGLYLGGGVTSVRDAVGYGFYFWSYELSKRYMHVGDGSDQHAAWGVLLCGGIAGVVTWASIFPLDVIKTRLQTQAMLEGRGERVQQQPLLEISRNTTSIVSSHRRGAWKTAKEAYRHEGVNVFFRGLGVCSIRAFIVNAVQWAVYEWTMRALKPRHV